MYTIYTYIHMCKFLVAAVHFILALLPPRSQCFYRVVGRHYSQIRDVIRRAKKYQTPAGKTSGISLERTGLVSAYILYISKNTYMPLPNVARVRA